MYLRHGLVKVCCILLLSSLFSCGNEEVIKSKDETPFVRVRFTALPEHVTSPAENLSSQDKIELGRLLFFDPILSGDKDVACATCHHLSSGYAEILEISIGVNG
ncbi:MAG: hypothetical protein KDC53_22430, partial [Saprospiraceae bacterium]|nr:hypothetical protein [Saprospiraceae bacterium]